jgi:hypothetical protein
MATKAEIKAAILKAAGNPESGVIFELADAMADSVSDLISGSDIKETRVIKPSEVR